MRRILKAALVNAAREGVTEKQEMRELTQRVLRGEGRFAGSASARANAELRGDNGSAAPIPVEHGVATSEDPFAGLM